MREHAPPPLRTREREEASTGARSRRELERGTCVCVREGSAHVWRWEAWRSRRLYARDDSRKLQSSPSIRERGGEGGETGGGGGGRSEKKKDEGEDRPMGWRQGEIEELLSDQHRTEKLFPAFELLHTRAFPERRKGRPKWKSLEFLPLYERVCAVDCIRGSFLRGPIPIEVNFYLSIISILSGKEWCFSISFCPRLEI